jgi:hypothetical protein
MELERLAKDLMVLARKDDPSPADHQRARSLMKELRKMGMTNGQISELTGARWAETTVKEYTRGVTVMDSQPWQSTTAVFGEMVSRGLATEDVKETIAVRDKLKSGGTSLAEITELLVELKGAGIAVGILVALYREWKASGLTAPDAALALKYKGDIEGVGFGLGSLSDIAQAAQVLGSPEEVLKAIGKYGDINQLAQQLHAARQRLADEEGKIKERIEEGEQAVTEVEERERGARDRLSQLEQEVNARAGLLSNAEELEKLGLDATRLGDLCAAVTQISAKHGAGREEALQRFFGELKKYDAALGFQAEAKRWETIAETKKLEAERFKAQRDGLEMRYQERKEAVDAMESLLKQGVKPAQIPLWNGILGKFGGPEHFQQELGHYQRVEELLSAKEKEVERRESKIVEVDAKLKALKQELAQIQNSIRALSESGVKEISGAGEKAVTGLKSLSANIVKEVTEVSGQAIIEVKSLLAEIRTETKKLADLKAEAGKLEKELMYARYLTTGDQAVLKAFPKEVVISFLDRALEYCKLNQLNPMVRVPDGFPYKYRNSSVFSSTEIGLLDLIAWAEVGLVGAGQ